jgi:hypothetical protein
MLAIARCLVPVAFLLLSGCDDAFRSSPAPASTASGKTLRVTFRAAETDLISQGCGSLATVERYSILF